MPLIGPLERQEWGVGVRFGATGLNGEEGVVGMRQKKSDVVLDRHKRWREKQEEEEGIMVRERVEGEGKKKEKIKGKQEWRK